MKKIALASSMLLAASATTAAEASSYWGANLGSANMPYDVDSVMFSGFYGYQLLPFLGLEGRLATSTDHETDVGIDVRVEYLASALLRVNLRTDGVRPYLLVGGSHAQIDYSVEWVHVNDDDQDLTWGAGISFHHDNFGVQLEYLQYLDTDDIDLSGFNVGFVSHF